MRTVKSFLNIKALKHVTVETLHTNMNLKIGILLFGVLLFDMYTFTQDIQVLFPPLEIRGMPL